MVNDGDVLRMKMGVTWEFSYIKIYTCIKIFNHFNFVLPAKSLLLPVNRCSSISAAAAAKLLQLCPTLCDPMDSACQAPLSMRVSRQEYWS